MPRKKTKEEIITLFKEKHGEQYDYSLVSYTNSKTKVTVICPKHGNFQVTPQHHSNGTGCRKCYDDSQKISKEEFVSRSQKHWKDAYDYSLIEVMPTKGEMVKIICKEHNIIFTQEPRNHMRGHAGCKVCKSLKLSGSHESRGSTKSFAELTEDFIKRAKEKHGSKYSYKNFKYVNSFTKGTIHCPEHGDFEQTPSNHLKGTKCPKCSIFEFRKSSFKAKCKELGIDYYRALKRRQAGLEEEKIFNPEYIRNEREINKINVFGKDYPNLEEAIRALEPPASAQTISRWMDNGLSANEAFERIPNPGYAKGIIYLVTNIVNGKLYVGLTVQSLERRWKYHLEQAKAGHIKHEGSLHAAIRNSGAVHFIIEQIDSGTTKKDLERKERDWIKQLNTLAPFGYNISTGGVSGGSNSKQTIIDDKIFKSIKAAAEYLSSTKNITISAAKKRISTGRIDVKSPSPKGHSYVNTKIYKTWSNIVHAALNPKSKDFIPNISIFEDWKQFENFRRDVGEPEDTKMVFKRLNHEKGYFPENCRWVTRSEAANINTLNTKKKTSARNKKER